MYQAAEPTLGRARLAVVETSPIDFNLNSGREERQRRDLHARLTAPATPLGRADLLLGWAMASWDERHGWYDLAADHGHAVLARAGIDRRPSLFDADGYARVGGRPASAEGLARDVELAIHRHFQDYTFDDEAARDQARLVERIESHGTRVLLVDYPVIPAYRAVLEGRYEEAETRWRAALRASLPDRPLLRILPEPSEVIGDFRDADHLCRNGAIRLSGLIAEWSDVIRLRDSSAPAPTPDDGRTGTDPHYMIVTGSTSTDTPGQRTAP